MIITIDSREYKLRFGIGFVRELDEKYFVKNQMGIKFGVGLAQRIPYVLSGDVIALAEILYTATCTEEKRPTQKEIDAYIDDCEDIDALFDEVISELKKENATRKRTIEAEKNLAEAEAEEKAKAKKARTAVKKAAP